MEHSYSSLHPVSGASRPAAAVPIQIKKKSVRHPRKGMPTGRGNLEGALHVPQEGSSTVWPLQGGHALRWWYTESGVEGKEEGGGSQST